MLAFNARFSSFFIRRTTTTLSRHTKSAADKNRNYDIFRPRRCAAHSTSRRRQEDCCILLRFGRGQLCLCCGASYETAPNSNGSQPDYELWLVQEDGDLCKSKNAVQVSLPFYFSLCQSETAGALCRCFFSYHERWCDCQHLQLADLLRSAPSQLPILR